MKPLICPQCGGKITDYNQWQKFTTCHYCGTTFVIDEQKPPAVDFEPLYEAPTVPNDARKTIVGIIGGVLLVFIILAVLTLSAIKPKKINDYSPYPTPGNSKQAASTPASPQNLLEFGGKGTGDGLFEDASAITVDRQGRIYVSDDSMRVQQFDANGKYLKVWQIPTQTERYKRARTIQKIAVDDKNRLYVLVGGTILVYDPNATEPSNTIHVAPDFMIDFALRSDGTMLVVSTNDEIETLLYINKAGKITRRVEGFLSDTADAAISPRETGLSAIRIAVDGAGSIYSIYAFGDLGGYMVSSNPEDMMIFRFTPEAKYVNKFVQSMKSCGIEVDNQSRIYITDEGVINVYTNKSELVRIVSDLSRINAFALDKENNIYVLNDDKVIKRAAIR